MFTLTLRISLWPGRARCDLAGRTAGDFGAVRTFSIRCFRHHIFSMSLKDMDKDLRVKALQQGVNHFGVNLTIAAGEFAMPLKLSLKPGEAVIVNGAVLRNGDRRGTMLLANQARVLREKDVLRPEDIETPQERAYFAIMQLYLMGEHDGVVYDQVASALAEVLDSAEDDDERQTILNMSRACAAGETYQALSMCRKFMRRQSGGGHG